MTNVPVPAAASLASSALNPTGVLATIAIGLLLLYDLELRLNPRIGLGE